MDPFGIFELLDTLSALTAEENIAEEPAQNPQNERRVSPDDKAFFPPDMGGGILNAENAKNVSAIEALYERHDKISKRIDDKK